MSEAVDRFLQRLIDLYGEPNRDNPAGFLSELSHAIGPQTAVDLDKAFNRVIDEHKARGWPSPGVIVNAVRSIRNERSERTPQQSAAEIFDVTIPHRRMCGPLADRAVSEGWHLGMNQFIYETGRLPGPRRIEKLKRGQKFIDDVASGDWQGEAGMIGRAAVFDMAAKYLDRRQKLTENYARGIYA